MREDFHECHMSNPKGNYKGNPPARGGRSFAPYPREGGAAKVGHPGHPSGTPTSRLNVTNLLPWTSRTGYYSFMSKDSLVDCASLRFSDLREAELFILKVVQSGQGSIATAPSTVRQR